MAMEPHFCLTDVEISWEPSIWLLNKDCCNLCSGLFVIGIHYMLRDTVSKIGKPCPCTNVNSCELEDVLMLCGGRCHSEYFAYVANPLIGRNMLMVPIGLHWPIHSASHWPTGP